MTLYVDELLDLQRIRCNNSAASKKRALEQLSELLASGQGALTQNEIFESLLARERLGSTGLGHGVAIPHGRVKKGERTSVAIVKLKEGIDYDAADGVPVDLLFALLVPEHSTEEHLQLLAQLAAMFSDPELVSRLRSATDSRSLLEVVDQWAQAHRPAA